MRARRLPRLRAFAAKLRGFLRGQRDDRDFQDEIQDHLQRLTERFIAQGLARDDAIRAARRQFGNTTLLKEDRRALQTLPSIEILWRDLRYAVRTLSRSPGFAAAAVLALALGIASNTAIFSVVHATFLAPLPYQDSDQLVFVWSSNRSGRSATTAADFFEWRRRSSAFSELHVTGMRMVNLAGGDRPEQVRAQFATPGLPGMMCLGYPLAMGRLFLEEEGTPGKDQVVILGALIGSVGAYFVARSMRGMVPGVSPGDPTAFIVVVATLIGAALVACLVPASRAASVDPMAALRQE